MTDNNETQLTLEVPMELTNKRLDQVLGRLMPQYSRALLQRWIKDGHVKVNGTVMMQQRYKAMAGQIITVDVLAASSELMAKAQPQNIQLDIVHEDQDIIVINKPVGLVVHPGAGRNDGTLLNALLHYIPKLAQLPRAGIVHRLDKDTSGLLVIARNLMAHKKLVAALQAREVKREYQAIVRGKIIAGGTINVPIGRHQTKRTLMAVIENGNSKGREAVTHYRVIERMMQHTYIQVMLETGRTHQIRVHMAYIDHPIIGDQVYGGGMKFSKGASVELRQFLLNFKRQALHAAKLTLIHPTTNKEIEFTAPLPQDMQELLQLLR